MRAWLILSGLVVVLAPAAAYGQDAPTTPEERTACAAAAYARAEAAAVAAGPIEIVIAPGVTQPSAVRASIGRQLQAALERTGRLDHGFEAVTRCGSPEWTIAADVRRGELEEALNEAVRRGLTMLEDDTFRQGIEQHVRAVECVATLHYVTAVRMARAQSLPTAPARTALDRLLHTPFATAQACVADRRETDTSIAPLTLADIVPFAA
jgi:hypothetical protein